jgi:acyl carrier protein
MEEALAAIWRDVLSLERVGRQESFFEIGGHSLLATVVVSRIRRAFAIELPLRHIFSAPTVAALAEHLEPLLASRMVQRAVLDDAAGREEITL